MAGLIVLVLTSLNAISQTSNDSLTCIPNSQLKIAAKLIERGRVDSAELSFQKKAASLLSEQIQVKESIIAGLSQKIDLQKQIEATYERDKASYLDQISIVNREVLRLQKDVRKQKRKTFFTALAGIAATGLALYFSN